MGTSVSDRSVAPLLRRFTFATVSAAAGAPLLSCAILATVRGSVTNTTAALVLVLIVVGAASTGLRSAGLVAAVSSGLWFDILLTEPYGRLAIDDRNDIEATLLLVVIGAAVTEIALWGHRQQGRAARRSGYLDGVFSTAEIVLRRDTEESLVAHVASQIQELLDIDECRFVFGPPANPQLPVLDRHGVVRRRDRDLKVDRFGMPTDDETAILVRRGDVTLGHFLLNATSRVARPTVEQRKVAVLLAGQAGAGLGVEGRGATDG